MKSAFQLAQGVDVADPSGIVEGYSVRVIQAGYTAFTVNVSAEKIPKVFRNLIRLVVEPAFFVLELPTHRNVEQQLRKSPSDHFHNDVYFLNQVTWRIADEIFTSYAHLFVHDGALNFGFGSHTGYDEIFVGPYKIFSIFADHSQKYHHALRDLGYQELPQIKTVRDTISRESPGSRHVLNDANPTIWQMADELKNRGMQLKTRREDSS